MGAAWARHDICKSAFSAPVLLVMCIDGITLTAVLLVWVCVTFVANCDVIVEGTFITRKESAFEVSMFEFCSRS